MKPAPFQYHAPTTIAEVVGAARRARRRRQGARRRAEPGADAGAAPRPLRPPRRPRPGRRSCRGIERRNGARGHRRRARRDAGLERDADVAVGCPAAGRGDAATSATSRSATGARSAARWPTPTRRPSTRRWPSALDAAARAVVGAGGTRTVAGRGLLPRRVDDRAGARRAAGRRSTSRCGPAALGVRRRRVRPPPRRLRHRRRGRRRRAGRRRRDRAGRRSRCFGAGPARRCGPAAAEQALAGQPGRRRSTPRPSAQLAVADTTTRPTTCTAPADVPPPGRRPRWSPTAVATAIAQAAGGEHVTLRSRRSRSPSTAPATRVRVEPRKTLADFLREDCAPHRHPPRLRARRVRRLHRPARRRGRALVPDVRRAGRRRRRSPPSRAWRAADGAAEPVQEAFRAVPRPAVRLLHARASSCRSRRSCVTHPDPDRRRDPRRPVGQPVPLHRLPGDRRGGARRAASGRGSRHDRGRRAAATPAGNRFVGQRVPRREDARLLTGQRHVRRRRRACPGCCTSRSCAATSRRAASPASTSTRGAARCPVSSPCSPAPTSTAARHDVVGRLRRRRRHGPRPVPRASADGDVRFVGDPVAVVVAESRYLAEDAVRARRASTIEPIDADRRLRRGAGRRGADRCTPSWTRNVRGRASRSPTDPELRRDLRRRRPRRHRDVPPAPPLCVPDGDPRLVADWDPLARRARGAHLDPEPARGPRLPARALGVAREPRPGRAWATSAAASARRCS